MYIIPIYTLFILKVRQALVVIAVSSHSYCATNPSSLNDNITRILYF